LGSAADLLQTVRGVGFRLADPTETGPQPDDGESKIIPKSGSQEDRGLSNSRPR